MMDDHEFCDSCPGCRPVVCEINKDTYEVVPMPQDSPAMVAVNEFWDTCTSYAQRRAYIEVTLKNSRKPDDLRLASEVSDGIHQVLRKVLQ